MRSWVFILLLGCQEYVLADLGPKTNDTDTDLDDTDTDLPDDTDEPIDTQPPPEPRLPNPGEVVISELMIDPDAVNDGHGEWIEVRSGAFDPLDLTGCKLGDLSIDSTPIISASSGALVVQPFEYLVLCVDHNSSTNGGVTCGGRYSPTGPSGSFEMENDGDEVLLYAANG
ncbi:MAG: lamin tail domain-containing protein, partial [Proteobacteria bacterium]|nr:lamin tail domain-containing protein [Pseudomonadota bacterium]